MTERSMWIKLAELWDKPATHDLSKPTVCVFPVVGSPDDDMAAPCFGLCRSVIRLHSRGDISAEVAIAALSRISAHLDSIGRSGHVYGWPLNAEGAKHRADACRQFAAECCG